MKANDILENNSLDEAKMTPTSFANAIGEGDTKGVLIGFEFEVCVPKSVVQKSASKEDRDIQIIKRYFKHSANFLDFSLDKNDEYYFDPKLFDQLLRIKTDKSPYSSVTDALNSLKPDIRSEYTDYADIIYLIFGNVGPSTVESNLPDYFDIIDAKGLIEKLKKLYDMPELDYAGPDEEADHIYQETATFLQPIVAETMNTSVVIFNRRHEYKKTFDNWYIEPDFSITPRKNDAGIEIVTPPLTAEKAREDLKKFYELAKKYKFYTSADNDTGLHINVSIPQKLDVLKLAVFLGDTYVAKSFGRENNEYVELVMNKLKNEFDIDSQYRDLYKTKKLKGKNIALPTRTKQTYAINYKMLNDIASEVTRSHYSSISTEQPNYISFRHAGGDYLNDYNGVLQIVGRFVQAMIIASDPNLYREEYLKKLTQLFGSPKRPESSKSGEIRKIREIVQVIKTNGLPVLSVNIASRSNPLNRDNAALLELDLMPWHILSYFNKDTGNYVFNSSDVKKNILDELTKSALFVTKKRIEEQPISHFAYHEMFPQIDITDKKELSKLYNIVRMEKVSTSTAGVIVMNVSVVPHTDNRVQEFVKKLIKNASAKDSVDESLMYPEQPIYYFAYGMLTDPDRMRGDGIELVGMAELRNFQYKMYQFANVESTTGDSVYGTLWKINREILNKLDRVEGYPELYDRKTYPVYIGNKRYEAEVYTLTPYYRDRLEGTYPSKEYIRSIVNGYRHNNIPVAQVRYALEDIRPYDDERYR